MAFAALLNEEARELAADGVDVIQFDEPAFNVYMDEVSGVGHGGAGARGRRARLQDRGAHLLRLRHPGEHRLEGHAGSEWRQYEEIFPALARSRIDQVSLECRNSRVPMRADAAACGKDVLVGVIDVATERVETPEEVAATIAEALQFVPAERLFPCTNCGMAPMRRDVAEASSRARCRCGAGAAEARGVASRGTIDEAER